MAENGRLGQAGADDGFGQRPGVLFICRMDDFCLKQRGSPLSVPCHHFCQRFVYLVKRLAEMEVILVFLRDLRISGATVCQYHQRIVGGGIAVYGNHVEGVHHIRA